MNELRAYRLVKKKWKASAFDGEGARLFGGRWNSRGQPCIYVAASESLAMLEIMVHLDDYGLMSHYALYEVLIPQDSIVWLQSDQLPPDWREEPAPPSTAAIGDVWLSSRQSLALAVPSVIVPREYNFVLNPVHDLFAPLIEGAKEIDFQPDVRLY
mgnify:FL=1